MGTRQYLVFLICLSVSAFIYAQNQIEYRSDFGYIHPDNPNDINLTKNVFFEHKGMTMYCDSAIYNQKDNYFFAYGNIDIYFDDSTHLTGNECNYFGNERVGEIKGSDVILEDGSMTMQTDFLLLDRNDNTVRYLNGAYIWDEENTLVSKEGIYFIENKKFKFNYDVEMTSEKAVINTDTMEYFTKTDIAICSGYTHILLTDDSTEITTAYGQYNTKTDEVYCSQKTQIFTKERYLQGDSIYYNKQQKQGYAYGNVAMKDTVNNLFFDCDTVNLYKIDTLSQMVMTGNLLIRQIDREDTLFFHSDTVIVVMDTDYNAKYGYAFKHCKFFRTDIQGAAEYCSYDTEDSVFTMLINPVLWTQDTQLSSDTIKMTTDKKHIKTLYMFPNPFIAQNSDTNTSEYFNQISGKTLTGYFENNNLYYAEIDGNTYSIYYLWDENKRNKTKKMTGINIGTSRKLNLYFRKGELKKMTAEKNPEFYMDNPKNVDEKDRQLKGFKWYETDKPKQPSDIFIHRL